MVPNLAKRILSIAALMVVTLLSLASSSRANQIVSTIGGFDEPADFSGNYPSSVENLGAFTFSIPTGFVIGSVTISGTFGNNDVPGTTNVTADSDYYVAGTTGGTTVEVATCDTPTYPRPEALRCLATPAA